MRIISGKLKGKSISYLRSLNTRPLKDSVKENIFNVLSHSNLLNIKLEQSNVLDLYAGIGSFGIECISRGAKKVTFVEKNINAIKVLKNNLSNLSITNSSILEENDIEQFLKKKNSQKFEIIFLDPPFAEDNFLKILEIINKKKNYLDDHLVVIHREKKSNDNLESILDPIVIKEYGRSKIIFGKFLN
jgi:16S rRNA (guanine966-N2)-methyltransferase